MLFGFQNVSVVEEFVVRSFSKNDVLPTNTVTDIHSTKHGFLITASIEGLIIYDGLNWDVLHTGNSPELLSDRILKIFETEAGQVFIQDQSNHLYYLNKAREIRIINYPESDIPVVVEAAASFDDNLVVLTNDQIININTELLIEGIPHAFEGKIWDVAKIDNHLYAITSDGLYRGDVDGGSILVSEFDHVNLEYFTRIQVQDKRVLIMGNGGVDCFDTQTLKKCKELAFNSIDDEKVYHITMLDEEEYLIATTLRLLKMNGSKVTELIEDEALMYESLIQNNSGNFILTTQRVIENNREIYTPNIEFVDATSDGTSLWLTSDQYGIVQIQLNRFSHFNSKGLVNSYAVINSKDGVYGGSFEYGFSALKNSNALISTENSALPNNTVRMMATMNDGGIVLSTWGKAPVLFKNGDILPLSQFSGIKWPTTNVAEAFYEDEDGRFLIGSLEQLYLIDTNTVAAITFSDGSAVKKVNRIVPDPFSEKLYLCTQDNGLLVYENGSIHSFSTGTIPRHIRDVYVINKNELLLASYSDGLVQLKFDDFKNLISVKAADEINGLPDTGFHRILKGSDDHLWISSNDGLIRIEEKALVEAAETGAKLKNYSIYTETDGLLNREFNGGTQSTGISDEHGFLWFTNQSGLVRVNPQDFRRKTDSEISFYIRNINENNSYEEWLSSDSVLFSGWKNDIEISFAQINTSNNSTNQVWYSVDGEQWQFPKQTGLTNNEKLLRGNMEVQFAMYPQTSSFFTLTIIRDAPFFNQLWMQLLAALGVLLAIVTVIVHHRNRTNVLADFENEDLESSEEKQKLPSEVDSIISVVNNHYQDSNFNLDVLASEVKMSRSSLYRAWAKAREESLNEFILSVRLEKAVELMSTTQKTITEIADETGFSSQSYFSKVFKKHYKVSPTQFMEQFEKINS
jgi:AraC-like DNA-binding protein/ligand-binding sensor domain-containing protein